MYKDLYCNGLYCTASAPPLWEDSLSLGACICFPGIVSHSTTPKLFHLKFSLKSYSGKQEHIMLARQLPNASNMQSASTAMKACTLTGTLEILTGSGKAATQSFQSLASQGWTTECFPWECTLCLLVKHRFLWVEEEQNHQQVQLLWTHLKFRNVQRWGR